MNPKKREALVMWLLAVFIGAVLFAVTCHAQSNSIGVFDGSGHLIYTIPLPGQIMGVLMSLAGFAWLAKILLKFLPTPQPGTFMAWVVAFLKWVGAATPEKHQADVPVSAPTDNGIDAPIKIPPTTNFKG